MTLVIYGPLSVEEVRNEKFEKPLMLEEKIDAERQSKSDTQTVILTFNPETEGTYAFCVDNRAAKFITKLVEVLIVHMF